MTETQNSNFNAQNLLSKQLFKIASEKQNPDKEYNELVLEIRRELSISGKHLTMWLNNKSQPNFNQFTQLVSLLKTHDPKITADSLIKYN